MSKNIKSCLACEFYRTETKKNSTEPRMICVKPEELKKTKGASYIVMNKMPHPTCDE